MPHKVLVTGGAGFIGSHLVENLLARGERVVVLDDLSSGRVANLPTGVELIRADVLDIDAAALQGIGAVFHLAARVSVQECITDWAGGHRVNLCGAMAVLHAAWRAGNVPVVYASSAAVYGNRSDQPCAETDLPMPISPYAADKLACEHQARAMAEVHGVASAGLRFFNVYGPRQDATSAYSGVISCFCANRLAERPHVVFGDGGQSRDFIHVRDVVRGLLLAREALLQDGAGAQVFNLCTGRSTTLLDLAGQLDAITGGSPNAIDFVGARHGDIRNSRGCTRAAQARLGFHAEIDLREGLADLWRWVATAPPPQAKGSAG